MKKRIFTKKILAMVSALALTVTSVPQTALESLAAETVGREESVTETTGQEEAVAEVEKNTSVPEENAAPDSETEGEEANPEDEIIYVAEEVSETAKTLDSDLALDNTGKYYAEYDNENLENKTCKITRICNVSGQVEIPSTVNLQVDTDQDGNEDAYIDYTVTALGKDGGNIFGPSTNTTVTSVKIPATVNSIDVGTFNFCTGITKFIVDGSNATYTNLNGYSNLKVLRPIQIIIFSRKMEQS